MTRVGISGLTSYWGIRALAREAPEDFVARVETGLDVETRRRLELGLWAARWVTRLQQGALVAFAGGGLVLWGGLIVARGSGDLVAGVWYVTLAIWLLAIALLVASAAIVAVHHRELHHLKTFIDAMRRSSLARDME